MNTAQEFASKKAIDSIMDGLALTGMSSGDLDFCEGMIEPVIEKLILESIIAEHRMLSSNSKSPPKDCFKAILESGDK